MVAWPFLVTNRNKNDARARNEKVVMEEWQGKWGAITLNVNAAQQGIKEEEQEQEQQAVLFIYM